MSRMDKKQRTSRVDNQNNEAIANALGKTVDGVSKALDIVIVVVGVALMLPFIALALLLILV